MLIPVSVPGGAFLQPDIVRKAAAAQSTAALFCASLAKRLTTLRAELGRMGRVIGGLPAALAAREPGRAWGCRIPAELAGVGRAAAALQLAAAGLGSGFLLPQFAQNLPVLPVWPQHSRSSLRGQRPGLGVRRPAAARPSGTGSGRSYRPPAPAMFMPIKAMAGPAP